ncbi:hypothetical protein JOY44_20460 [Phormidium sp. CLA17]|uniref:hypothetical protein n=1 Tax=Leptolyngbya sp. Cla-17 TaxID=2803751 RepID=UPI0014930128|nr:hypothetical protein [Leptolyngbya sp. Cla-17]MBM0743965.1 hypothetical protein [Leptolyngbya sp. Cla-17]
MARSDYVKLSIPALLFAGAAAPLAIAPFPINTQYRAICSARELHSVSTSTF